MISSMSVFICNRFHAGRANSGKKRDFTEYPFFTLSIKGNFLTQRHGISLQIKIEFLRQLTAKIS